MFDWRSWFLGLAFGFPLAVLVRRLDQDPPDALGTISLVALVTAFILTIVYVRKK